MKEIVRIKFGSHLYGINTPSSDDDWKGVFVPETRDVLLGRIPKTTNSQKGDNGQKNLPGQLDIENYSLHHFVRLATQGQTVAIDMLFAPSQFVEPGPYFYIWEDIQRNREKLISKRMNAFIGYARAQASKYSLKGERLNKLLEFRDVISSLDVSIKDMWDRLPKDDERTNPQGIKELQIAGKWFGETTSKKVVIDSVNKLISRYGKRAKAAAGDNGVDWKALSHAVRVSVELEELLSTGNIVFPLRFAEELLEIKQGKYSLGVVQDWLDASLIRVERLIKESNLPDAIDNKWWDNWLAAIMAAEVKL